MKPRLFLYVLVVLTGAACAEATRDFDSTPGGAGGEEQTSSTTSGMGGQPGTGGGGMGGKPGTGGSGTGGQPGTGGTSTASHVGGAGGVGGMGGTGGAGGGTGGTGGQGPCIWIDITSNDCSSGIMIADFCPAGRKVNQLERCDGTFYTPDASYQQYKLSGCPGVCPIVGDHVSWRKIECCL